MASCSINEDLAAELELLSAMCSADELKVEEVGIGTKLVVKVMPMTAGDEEKQFLWCELDLVIGFDYPSQPPSLNLGSSRGLSDVARASLIKELSRCVEELQGEPALFAIVESGRAAITALNTPEGECAICLGSFSEVESEQVVRMPCYHILHRHCLIEYCQSEILRDRNGANNVDVAYPSILCPECRVEIPWTHYPELQKVFAQMECPQLISHEEPRDDQMNDFELDQPETVKQQELSQAPNKQSATVASHDMSNRDEAFIRLHHLYQGRDEKEKPLLRLLKECGLDAVVYYGKPALLHIQGDPKDVDSFAGTAKRRHITVTIDVAQRSVGPPIGNGIASVLAKKGSLDGVVLKDHLEKRGRSETTFTILGS